MSSEVEWKILSTIRRTVLAAADVDSASFNVHPNTGLYRQFGLPLKSSYIPLTLDPATAYYNYIQDRAKGSGCIVSEKKFPYYIAMPEVGGARFSMSFRIFPPSILAITARLRALGQDLADVPFNPLFSLRNPRLIPGIGDLIRWSFDLINQGQADGTSDSPKDSYAGFHFSNVSPNYWRDEQRRLVGLLIGNNDYDQMDDIIVKSVVNNSAEINRKSASEHLLINKQGVLFVTSQNWKPGHRGNRLQRAMALAEIALVCRSFLDNVYLESRNGQLEDFLDYIFLRIKAWIERPEAILNVSYTNTLHWKLLLSEFSLLEKLKLLENENPWLSDVLASKSRMFASATENWWAAKDFAYALFKST